jgi:isopenicillin-N epimerase
VVLLDTAYGSVNKMAARHFGGRVVTVAAPLPLADSSPEPLLAALDRALTDGDVALGVVDHVASKWALVMPAREIAAFFRVRGVPLLVDGAHGPGALDLADGQDGDPDFYVGSAHKWLCAPKSVGFVTPEPATPISDAHPRRGALSPLALYPTATECTDLAA